MGKMVDVGGILLSAIKSFYEEASAYVKISGETSEHFEIKVGLRQRCVMSPWLFNIYMDGVMREVKGKVGEVGVRMYAEFNFFFFFYLWIQLKGKRKWGKKARLLAVPYSERVVERKVNFGCRSVLILPS